MKLGTANYHGLLKIDRLLMFYEYTSYVLSRKKKHAYISSILPTFR